MQIVLAVTQISYLLAFKPFNSPFQQKLEVMNENASEQGGYKEIICKISGEGVYSKLKFDSGVHRVQRVPETESQGRIHTSACTVAVLPEADELDAIELITEKTLSHIFHLTSLDVNSLRAEQLNNISVESFSKSIDDFKKRTQTALAFRFVLQQRGVVVPPFKLPIPQESVYEQVEDLKQKEHDCVEQIKIEINIIINITTIR